MAKKSTHKSKYEPKNPAKYLGSGTIFYRSSWELTMMRFLDDNAAVIGWSSESVSIPYRNPLTGRFTVYVPDFLIIYDDKYGKRHVEMIEIKPAKEVPGLVKDQKISKRTKLTQILNAAKWQAAVGFCAKRGITFRVITENELYVFKRKKSS